VTIYIPELHELPREQLTLLGSGARFSLVEANGSVTAYIYEWTDLKIIVNVTSDSAVAGHLEGIIAWARTVATARGQPLDESLVQRIRGTTLILGFVVEGTTDRNVWHDRVQDLIAIICFNTGALLFWEGAIFDENCQQLLPAAF
jgi:hypothetical protein